MFVCVLATVIAAWPMAAGVAAEKPAAKAATYQVARCKIAVNGDPSGWKTIPPVMVRGEKQLWFGQGMTRQQWHGNGDLSYAWRAAWWGDKLYFLVEVTDDKVLGPDAAGSRSCATAWRSTSTTATAVAGGSGSWTAARTGSRSAIPRS